MVHLSTGYIFDWIYIDEKGSPTWIETPIELMFCFLAWSRHKMDRPAGDLALDHSHCISIYPYIDRYIHTY